MKQQGAFTEKLWTVIQPVYQQIINCQFIKRLADGTLPFEWFAHYLSQDVLYIIDDSRALAVVAGRAENPDETYFFLQLAKDGLDIERALHNDYILMLKIPEAKEKSPAFKAYSDFLTDNAFNAPYPVAATALLPCFWVYYNTMEHVYNNSVENNPYKKWIDAYSGGEYRRYTENFIKIVENLAQKSDSEIREQMISVFVEGTKHELRVFEESAGQ